MKKNLVVLAIILFSQIALFSVEPAVEVDALIKTQTALVVTWQDGSGKWFAAGPVQTTMIGFKTEQEALYFVYVAKFDSLKLIGNLNHFTIYSLDRTLETNEEDARAKLYVDNLAKN
ncbi:MAG: hypothetical protein MUC95_03355 [Spirochaetes bacterium]|jgi:hypothetical protein|nr:hypothetical protein [Spirochaetota bacterium]